MEIHILFFAAVLFVAHAGRVTRQAPVESAGDECQQPPENTEMVSCCDIPSRHVLGRIKDTIHFCVKEVRRNEAGSNPPTLPPPPADRKKHFFKHRIYDGCFVQCLFEREGFLVDNNINKQALIERITDTFADSEEWQETGSSVVEKCLSSEITVAANETCKSGSAEALRCIYKELFLQCPSWLEDDEYCTSLKNFYIKCPNGPPPEVFPKKKHMRHNRPKNSETESEPVAEDRDKDM